VIHGKEKGVETIGFVGSGNMAEAIVKGILSAGVYQPDNVITSDIRPERLEYFREHYRVGTMPSNTELASKSDVVVLGVKPQNMTETLESIKGAIKEEALVISIAAGIKVADIVAVLGDVPIVRVMPNTPALIGQGASALFANQEAAALIGKAMAIFAAVGKAVVVEDEDLIDAVTALSGSGPAYYFFLMEAMIKAGTTLGLPEAVATALVLQTAKGAGLLAVEADKSGESPAELRRKVTSPGGTTEAAIKVFADGKMDELISTAMTRAYDRSRELSK
jgi:pyrroline-5-carboxylate reductase